MSDSQPSLPVIISCAAVGGLILIFLAVRIGLCIHRRTRNPVPLPPARPLSALHTLPWNANPNASPANFSSSKLDLSSPSSLAPSTYSPELSMSQHHAHESRPRNMYRQYSGSTLNTEEMPLHQPPSPLTRASSPMPDASLVPPQPSFFASNGTSSNRSSAQLSFNSSTEESDIASYPPQRHQSVTAFPTDPLPEDSGGSPSVTPPLPDGYPRASGVHSRRVSVATSVSTTHTTRSKRSTRSQSTIRGPPHKPYNRVEIVLPAPLAPSGQRDSSYLHELYDGSVYSSVNTRQSVCDPWLRVGRESTGPVNVSRQPSRERERRHRTVSSESRSAPRSRHPSGSSVSSFTTNPTSISPNPNALPSQPQSPSRSPRQKASVTVDMSDLPPVPRVPSMYTNYTNSPPSSSPSTPVLALSDSITGNGRLRGLASESTMLNRTLPSNVDLNQQAPAAVPTTATANAAENVGSVQALSDSITGDGRPPGLANDSTAGSTDPPINVDTNQPVAMTAIPTSITSTAAVKRGSVLTLSDSITGNGKLRGLVSDSMLGNKALPSIGDLSQPAPAAPINISSAGADGEEGASVSVGG